MTRKGVLRIGGGSRGWGRASGSGGRKTLVGSRGKAPVMGVGDEFPQKLKQNVKLVYDF